MKIIKRIFSKRISKAIVDVLLFAGIFISIISSRSSEHSWWTFHCFVSVIWYLLMLVHIWQHWAMTKLTLQLNPKALKRNKLTLMTIVVFLLMTFSVICFISGVDDQLVHLHHKIAHLFWAFLLIHSITKRKQFFACLR